jgi:hypothetical protein
MDRFNSFDRFADIQDENNFAVWRFDVMFSRYQAVIKWIVPDNVQFDAIGPGRAAVRMMTANHAHCTVGDNFFFPVGTPIYQNGLCEPNALPDFELVDHFLAP